MDSQFQEALVKRRFHPQNLLALTLTDAVRVALVQNSDLRLARDDAQVARAFVFKAMAPFDSSVDISAGYSRKYLTGAGSEPVNQQEFSQALQNVLSTLRTNPNADPQTVVSNSLNQAQRRAVDSYGVRTGIAKEFRNGVGIGFNYIPTFQDQNGNGAWPPPHHQLYVTIGVPLTKFGVIANAGQEMASNKEYEGALLRLTHTATKATAEAVGAYWQCAAAVAKYNAADRSFRIADALLGLTRQLASKQSVVATDVTLAEVRKSEAAAARVAALVEVFRRSKDLSNKLGLKGGQLRALPYAVDEFPEIDAGQAARMHNDSLVDCALVRRLDRLAALKSVEAKRILAEKARIDLRPDFRVALSGGLDLNNDAYLNEPKRRGYTANPTFGVNLQFSYAPANHGARGDLMEAEANLDRSLGDADEIARSSALNIRTLVATIQQLSAQIGFQRQAVKASMETLTGVRQRFRFGSATLVDTFGAVFDLTATETALIDAEAALATSVGQLRFETATILQPSVPAPARPVSQKVEAVTISSQTLKTLPSESETAVPAGSSRSNERSEEHTRHYRSRP
ncbi:MAG: TolC family protein [Verrucomicrobia bacterium]|nr:TolC family protein [Verrucomicrobiota bacterium]